MKLISLCIATFTFGAMTSVVAAPVALMTPVVFAPTTDPRAEVRDECRLGAVLAEHIGESLRRVNGGPGTTESPQGDVMKVTVTSIWGARGNNWTGPKGLALDAVILHDGVVQRSTSIHRTTMGGFWGGFKGICGFMDRNAVTIGKDLARWSRDAKYVPPTDAPDASERASAPASDAAR